VVSAVYRAGHEIEGDVPTEKTQLLANFGSNRGDPCPKLKAFVAPKEANIIVTNYCLLFYNYIITNIIVGFPS